MKICFKCRVQKPLIDFYTHPETKDGHLNKCIECTKNDSSERLKIKSTDINWVQKEKARNRKRAPVKDINYANRYPEKHKATTAAKIIKRPIGMNGHHWSYNIEHYKDLIMLSPKDHKKCHQFIIYDQERMMYRRIDNNYLLNTKELHYKYILDKIKNELD